MGSIYKNNPAASPKCSGRLLMNMGGWLLSGLGVGAVVMYFLDPESGSDRRDNAKRLAAQARQRLNDVKETLTNAAQSDSVSDAVEQVTDMLPSRGDSSSLSLMPIAVTAIGCGIVGAAVMYILDPESGRRRRRYLRNQATSSVRGAADMVAQKTEHLRHKAHDLYNDAAKTMHNSRFPGIGSTEDHPNSQ